MAYKEYLFVGGMPEAVEEYGKNHNPELIRIIQQTILESYHNDMGKYNKQSEIPKTRIVYKNISTQLAKENKKFQYKNIKQGGRASEFEGAIEWLCLAGIASQNYRIEQITRTIVDNVNFDTNEIHICQKAVEHSKNGKHIVIISEDMKTESSRRTLPLIPDVREILLTHKAKQERQRKEFRNGYKKENLNMICLNPIGEIIKPNYVTTHFPEILNKYGLRKIRFHDPRHTCASMLLSKNIHMKVIQTWLGHSNMSTTADIYSHLESKSKLEAGNVISTLLAVEESEGNI